MHAAPAATSTALDDVLDRLARQPLWVYCLAAVLYFAFCDYRSEPLRLVTSLGDSDDALRLASVREYLASGAWFDRTFPRLGGDTPLISHWSRFIDAPLAVLIGGLGRIISTGTAELIARVVWPLSLLFALMWLFARQAHAQHGRVGALAVTGLIMYADTVTSQFSMGRIDHHNVMILGAAGGILLLAESFEKPRLGWLAGALLGLGTAIGYEALSLTAASLAIGALLAAWSGRGLEGIARAGAAFLATLAAAFVLTHTPVQMLGVRCDELSLNLLLLAAAGSSGLAAVGACKDALSAPARIAVLAGAGAAGLAAFGLAEPLCMSGPFAQADRGIMPIWLDHVEDTKNIIGVFGLMPAVGFVALFTVALGAWFARQAWARRPSQADALRTLVFFVAVVLGLWQAKFLPYATLFALPFIAAAISELSATAQMTALSRRLLAFFAFNQHTAAGIAGLAAGLISLTGAQVSGAEQKILARGNCLATAGLEELNALPKGRFAGHGDIGPFLVATTHHEALSAPYHRIDKAILRMHAIASAPSGAAEPLLRAAGIAYVIDCPSLGIYAHAPKTGLMVQLRAGVAPAYLEPVALSPANPLRVWRLKP